VTAVALGAVRAKAHVREEIGALGFVHEVEQHGGHAALAVALVGFHPRGVVAVGNACFADMEPQQPCAALVGAGNLGIVYSGRDKSGRQGPTGQAAAECRMIPPGCSRFFGIRAFFDIGISSFGSNGPEDFMALP